MNVATRSFRIRNLSLRPRRSQREGFDARFSAAGEGLVGNIRSRPAIPLDQKGLLCGKVEAENRLKVRSLAPEVRRDGL
jgi:hypothetical protein